MKQNRIELRASQTERELFFEAATFTGMTLSSFLRQAALEKTEDVLRHRDTLTLSDRDRDLFFNALENPPKPNRRLKQAFSSYKKRKTHVRTAPKAKKRIPKKSR